MSSLDFTDQTVVVTGISHGFGAEYATEFAKRGANLVINDRLKDTRRIPLTETAGSQACWQDLVSQVADSLVEKLHSLGANAIANYDDVGEGEKIIDTAVSHFGAVHVLVSNVGVIGHNSFRHMGDSEWKSMIRVQLKEFYKVTNIYSCPNSASDKS